MVSIERAWARVQAQIKAGNLDEYKGVSLEQLRFLVFGQTLVVSAAVGTVGPVANQFPEGAIILGITATSFTTTPAANNAFLMRKGFALSFAFAGGDSITPGGPITAEALLGTGEQSIFPSKELIIRPAQSILATGQNLTSDNITIEIAYHSLVRR
jgi:hypothetical protein